MVIEFTFSFSTEFEAIDIHSNNIAKKKGDSIKNGSNPNINNNPNIKGYIRIISKSAVVFNLIFKPHLFYLF
jgi:hypothetical protein